MMVQPKTDATFSVKLQEPRNKEKIKRKIKATTHIFVQQTTSKPK